MPATFAFDRDHGAATGSPPKGATTNTGVTDVNWKASDTEATAYSAAPIVATQNSFENWMYGHFTTPYNQLLNGLFAHTATALGTGLTLKGPPTMASAGNALVYTTPSQTTNANLTTNMTSVIAIASGVAVWFGPTGPQETATGKTASYSSNPAWTNYLTTQLQTSGSAAPGDTATITLTLQYDEN
jgi:hypothetical protein